MADVTVPLVNPVLQRKAIPAILGTKQDIPSLEEATVTLQGEAFESEHGTGQVGHFDKSYVLKDSRVWIKSLNLDRCSDRMKHCIEISNEINRYLTSGPPPKKPSDYLRAKAISSRFLLTFDIFQVGQCVHYVQGYAQRGSLDKIVATNYQVCTIPQVRTWTESLLKAIRWLQDYGISHRSIRLEHCLVDETMIIKLGGFTSAVKCFRNEGSVLLLQHKESRSTRNDHFPHECFAQSSYDPTRVDAFSVLVVAVTLVTKRKVFCPRANKWYSSQWTAFQKNHMQHKNLELRKLATQAFTPNPLLRPSASELLQGVYFRSSQEKAPNNSTKSTSKSKTKSAQSKRSNQSTGSKKSGRSCGQVKAEANVQLKPVFTETGSQEATGSEAGEFVYPAEHSESVQLFNGFDEQSESYGEPIVHQLVKR